jgi:superfamily II DNA or RNA helicase
MGLPFTTLTMTYKDFLASKSTACPAAGFDPQQFTAPLFPFQRDIVTMACRVGRFCIWADCGMGKTAMQLEWAHQVHQHTGRNVLVLAPLAVAHQTVREGSKFGISCAFAATQADVQPGITITNYEKLSHFDPAAFGGVVLDESSILKAYTGKIRNQIIESFAQTPFRLACSATPAPNDHMELGNHAEFIGVMTRTEMLAMFFVHDGGDTSKWRLKGHAQSKFWEWVCSWAVTIRKPSDLGYEDGSFILPELSIQDCTVETPREAMADDAGQMALFAMEARTLSDQRHVRKASLQMRVDAAAALANSNTEQWLVWCDLNDESKALTAAINGAVEVSGSDSDDHKRRAAIDFQDGKIRVLVSKPSIFGFGLNFQGCHNVAFVGLSHSYEAFYQAIRRCWRFGQQHPVNAHIIYDVAEGRVIENIRRKEADSIAMAESMVQIMKQSTMEHLKKIQRQVAPHITEHQSGDNWDLYMGDCVESIKQLDSDSIHYSIFSPPFASLYTYSNSDRDMGNSRNDQEFFDHFVYLAKELHRVLMPGRLISFHCMNLPSSKERDGFIGVKDFRGDMLRIFQSAGFVFHSEVCIWKDPVTAMQRTKAIGLLHKQIRKDSALSRQGIPDYLVTVRKLGDNPEPCAGPFTEFAGENPPAKTGDAIKDSINIWQRYASPVWMDINPSDTLQYRSARANDDERHICPLQLEVIRRGLQLWSNPGDLVLSPFAGIGSEGYVSLQMQRRFVGFELKPSYFNCAAKNLQSVESHKQGELV